MNVGISYLTLLTSLRTCQRKCMRERAYVRALVCATRLAQLDTSPFVSLMRCKTTLGLSHCFSASVLQRFSVRIGSSGRGKDFKTDLCVEKCASPSNL